MQARQREDPRSEAGVAPPMPLSAPDPETLATTLLTTLEHLTEIQNGLMRAARISDPASLTLSLQAADGANSAAYRVRRARQAASIQGAVNVLLELAREQRLAETTEPTR